MTIDHEHADLSIIRFVSTGMQKVPEEVSRTVSRSGRHWSGGRGSGGSTWVGETTNSQQPKCLNSKPVIPAQRTKPPNAPSTCCQHNQARQRQHCAFISWGRGGHPRVINLETAGCLF